MVSLPTICLVALPKATLRPTGLGVSPALREVADDEKRAKALFIDGRDTHLRVPAEAEIEIVADRGTIVVGTIETTISGGVTVFCERAFLWSGRGRATVLPVPKGCEDAWAMDLDRGSRVLLGASGGVPFQAIQDPFSGVRHAFVWQRGHFADVGPADRAHFTADGGVAGRYTVDPRGRAINASTQAAEKRPANFLWKNGIRTVSRQR